MENQRKSEVMTSDKGKIFKDSTLKRDIAHNFNVLFHS